MELLRLGDNIGLQREIIEDIELVEVREAEEGDIARFSLGPFILGCLGSTYNTTLVFL